MSTWKSVPRGLLKQPGFTALVTLTLALGIGANTAVFSLVQAFLLRPLPLPAPDRLVELRTLNRRPGGSEMGVSPLDADDYARAGRGVAALGYFNTDRVNLVADGSAASIQWTRANPGFFAALAVPPQIGRTFNEDEARPGGDVYKAVLSDRLWKDAYGADPGILGRRIDTVLGRYEVVGVMPPGFSFPDGTSLWVTVQSHYQTRRLERDNQEYRNVRTYAAVARLAEGADIDLARQELEAVGARLEREYPRTNEAMAPGLRPLQEAETARFRPYLLLLGAAVAVVLLICCANVANLLLVRAEQRTRELTVCAALGASRGRLAAMLLSESLCLAAAGGVGGLLLGAAIVRLFPLAAPADLPSWVKVELDGSTFAFALAIAALSGVLFGLAPMVRLRRLDLAQQIREGSRGASARRGWLRPALVASEIGLSLAVVALAGLLLRTLDRLQQVDLGFEKEQTLTLRLTAFQAGDNEERIRGVTAYYERVMQRLRELPGVVAVGATDNFPYSGSPYNQRAVRNVEVRGETDAERRERGPALFVDCSPGYFEAMNIPLLEGRDFREDDDLRGPKVMILSERTARRLFPDRSPLGREMRVVSDGSVNDAWATVVGVVGNVKYDPRDGNDTLELYYSHKQYGLATTTVAIRLRGPVEAFRTAAAEAAAAVDPTVAVEKVETMGGLVDEQLWQERLWSLLLGCFAALTVVLASVGVFGVMSYTVAQRHREIGVRAALGADRRRIVRLVLSEGLRIAAVGVALGLAMLPVVERLSGRLLFGVGASDPAAIAGGLALMIGVTVLACTVPAWRAAAVDPVEALRED